MSIVLMMILLVFFFLNVGSISFWIGWHELKSWSIVINRAIFTCEIIISIFTTGLDGLLTTHDLGR